MSDFLILKDLAVGGLKWSCLGQFFSYLLQFLVWVILSRSLPPDNFGALSVALIFSNLVIVFNELGLSSAIIQSQKLTLKHKITVFWVCVFISIFLIFLVMLFSVPLANFFQNKIIGPLMVIFAFKFLIDSLGLVQESLLKKDLLFKKLAFFEISSSIVFAFTALFLVRYGFDIRAIAWGYLAGSLVKVILLWRSLSFRPNFSFDWPSFKELFWFGGNIVGFKIFSYLTGNVDIALIGKLLGSSALGYYSMALNLVNFPRQKLGSIISNVIFPVFSKMQDDYEQMRKAYLKIIRYASVINFPLLFGLMFLASPFVYAVYSYRWSAMVLPLQILCIYGLFFSLTTFSGIIFNATGHPEYSFRFSLVMFLGIILAISSSIKYGLSAVTSALSVYALVMNIWGNLWVRKIIKMSIISYFNAMVPAVISSAVMVFFLSTLKLFYMHFSLSLNLWFLLIMIFAGGIIYILALFLADRPTFEEIRQIIYKMLSLT